MRKKPKKISKRKQLEKDCLDLWSKCVRARDGKCRYCGNDTKLSGHHIRSVTHQSTKYDLNNGLCLCWNCHSQQKWHPERFQDMVIEIIGDEKYQGLKTKSLEVVQYSIADLEDLKQDLTKRLARIKAGLDFDNLPF